MEGGMKNWRFLTNISHAFRKRHKIRPYFAMENQCDLSNSAISNDLRVTAKRDFKITPINIRRKSRDLPLRYANVTGK